LLIFVFVSYFVVIWNLADKLFALRLDFEHFLLNEADSCVDNLFRYDVKKRLRISWD
jgi:hypothetical protein